MRQGCYGLDAVPGSLKYLVFMTPLWGGEGSSHFEAEETEAQVGF